jgi:hypothetical protein
MRSSCLASDRLPLNFGIPLLGADVDLLIEQAVWGFGVRLLEKSSPVSGLSNLLRARTRKWPLMFAL